MYFHFNGKRIKRIVLYTRQPFKYAFTLLHDSMSNYECLQLRVIVNIVISGLRSKK